MQRRTEEEVLNSLGNTIYRFLNFESARDADPCNALMLLAPYTSALLTYLSISHTEARCSSTSAMANTI